MNAFIIRTGTDFRPTIYSNGFTYRVLVSLPPESHSILRKALDQVFNDLTYLDTTEPDLVSAYVKRINEPLHVVDRLGLEMLALVSSNKRIFADGTMPEWTHVYYLTVTKQSFFRVRTAPSSATVHRFDPRCEEAMKSLMTAVLRNAPIATWPDSGTVVKEHKGSVLWCSSCHSDNQPSELSDKATPSLERPENLAIQPPDNRRAGSRKSIWGIGSRLLSSRLLAVIRSLRSSGTIFTRLFTKELRDIDLRARQITLRYQHEQVDLAHFLLVFIEDSDVRFRGISNQGDPELKATRSKIQAFLDGVPKSPLKIRRGRDLGYTRRLEAVMDHASNEASRVGQKRISPARLFLALASEDFYSEAERGAVSARLLSPAGMTPWQIERSLLGSTAAGSSRQLSS